MKKTLLLILLAAVIMSSCRAYHIDKQNPCKRYYKREKPFKA